MLGCTATVEKLFALGYGDAELPELRGFAMNDETAFVMLFATVLLFGPVRVGTARAPMTEAGVSSKGTRGSAPPTPDPLTADARAV